MGFMEDYAKDLEEEINSLIGTVLDDIEAQPDRASKIIFLKQWSNAIAEEHLQLGQLSGQSGMSIAQIEEMLESEAPENRILRETFGE